MSAGRATPTAMTSSSSSNTMQIPRCRDSPDTAQQRDSTPSPTSEAYHSPAYLAKGKQRASDDDLKNVASDEGRLSHAVEQLHLDNTQPAQHQRSLSVDSSSSASILSESKSPIHHRPTSARRSTEERDESRSVPTHSSKERARSSRSSSRESRSARPLSKAADRRKRLGRDTASRSLAPKPLRSPALSSATTGSATQYLSLLGQPVVVAASISVPERSSVATTTAALPSLHKASRGRSINVSPSRRWDRRGASATVLSGASASGSGTEDLSDADLSAHARISSRRAEKSRSKESRTHNHDRPRPTSIPREEALFPSDEDDSPQLSSDDEGTAKGRTTRTRRWSSVERDRRRGLRILLQERNAAALSDELAAGKLSNGSSPLRFKLSRRSSAASDLSIDGPDASEIEASSPSTCSSCSDINHAIETNPSEEGAAAIPILESQRRRSGQEDLASSAGAASSQDQNPSSTESSSDPSPAASTPATSLVHRSPPGFTPLKAISSMPVSTEADPLLGLGTPSVEELIQVDKVEFFPEEAVIRAKDLATTRRKTSPKAGKKASWIIGDFESEPESDGDDAVSDAKQSLGRNVAASSGNFLLPVSASSYQARLANLQSQLRMWSRSDGSSSSSASAAPRTREISSGSEEGADGQEKESTSLLSASWRNLARLPNLILLPGLAARQARESLSKSPPKPEKHPERSALASEQRQQEQDFAQIFRLAVGPQSPVDEKNIEARRSVALKAGRPPSPSPSPSPPTSLLGSRQSSNDSVSTADKGSTASQSKVHQRGRGVASLVEADQDPSAYVSGLGQPIDPDTELSSVVHLQTFRSRSRSRPAENHRSPVLDEQAIQGRHGRKVSDLDLTRSPRSPGSPLSPGKPGKTLQLEPIDDVALPPPITSSPVSPRPTPASGRRVPSDGLKIVIPSAGVGGRGRGLFEEGPAPTDIASAPTSPTYRMVGSGSEPSSGDEGDHASHRSTDGKQADVEGFRVVRRRRRRSSGPRSSRPKVEAPVPQGYSAFSQDDRDHDSSSGTNNDEYEGEQDMEYDVRTSVRGRRHRDRRGRRSSPRRSNRQCAIGLFGGGQSAESGFGDLNQSERASCRGGRSTSRRDGSHISISAPIRSVRSSPNLTYAAAAAAARREGENAEDNDVRKDEGSSPPRGSRGRRGAVKVVASSVGQRPLAPSPLLLSGMEGLRRGPSYPPRADQIFTEESGAQGTVDPSSSLHAASNGSSDSMRRSASGVGYDSSSLPQALRFRLLSNSSHLLMLSLELDMIKKQKISAPLKPRWGKHRANDFNPLPSVYSSSSFLSFRCSRAMAMSMENETSTLGNDSGKDGKEAQARAAANMQPSAVQIPAQNMGLGGDTTTTPFGLRDPGSRLKLCWSLADLTTTPTSLESA